MLQECHLKFYKLSLYSNNNNATYKEFFGCLRTDLCNIWWFVFLSFWPFFILGWRNFFNSNLFLMILSALDVPIGRIQVLFEH
jgi:hypothetical protein